MHYDVIIIGGSFAGLSAALYLARARRSVCIVDAGKPRNRFAEHSHGFLSRDGSDPRALLAAARAQVSEYPSVTFLHGLAIDASMEAGRCYVAMDSGEVLTSSKLLLAYGISDKLPAIQGLAERWGKSAFHCPYCHGYEFSGQNLGVLNLSPMSAHQAILISEWGPTTYFLNGAPPVDQDLRKHLAGRQIAVETAPVVALVGSGTSLSGIHLEDGQVRTIDALFLAPPTYLNSPIAEQLGCEIDEGPLGTTVRTDDTKMTSITDVYAAGDITRSAHNITFACADGVMAAMAMHRSLVFDATKTEAQA